MAKRRTQKASKALADAAARQKIRKLWHMGALFHNAYRFPRKRTAPRIDRLAGILKMGLLAPAAARDASVYSDLNIVFEGSKIGYDRLVFLHRYDERSYLYTMSEPGRFTVFIDPELPVITQEDMGENWCVLCQDEVYVRDRIALDKVLGVLVNSADAESILQELSDEFRRAQIPLYNDECKVLWPV